MRVKKNTPAYRRNSLAVVVCLSVTASTMGVAQAQDTKVQNKTIAVTHDCVGTEYTRVIGPSPKTLSDSVLQFTPNDFKVTYPEQAAPNGQFEVTIAPSQMSLKDNSVAFFGASDIGRLKYDIVVPEGVKVASATLGAATGLMPGAAAPVATVIDEEGNPDPNGHIVRVDGGHTVNNGPNAAINSPAAGLRIKAKSKFTLPSLTLKLVATNVAGQELSVGLRGAGAPAERGGINNSFSFAQDDSIADDDYWCVPTNPEAGKLTTTRVVGSSNIALSKTELDIITGETDTRLQAQVTTTAGNSQLLSQGKVEFFVDGKSIGEVNPDESGLAVLTHTFPQLDDREPKKYNVTARFKGVDSRILPSSDSETMRVTVNPIPITDVTTATTLTTRVAAVEDAQLPVVLNASVDATDSSALPASGAVQFYRDGEAIGKPVAVKNGRASFVDKVSAEEATGKSYSYTAKFSEVIDESVAKRYLESESEPATVDVNGQQQTQTTLEASATELAHGEVAKLTSTLTFGEDKTPLAGQKIQFRVNGLDHGEPVVTDEKGVATLETKLAPGENKVTAHFYGEDVDSVQYAGSESAAVDIKVADKSKFATEVDLVVNPTAEHGKEAKLTATINAEDAPAGALDRGTVSFFVAGRLVGVAPAQAVDGKIQATITHTFSGAGDQEVYAVYSGVEDDDIQVLPSQSGKTTVAVSAVDIVIEETTPPAPQPGGSDMSGAPGSDSLGGGSQGSDSQGSSKVDNKTLLAWILGGLGLSGLIALVVGLFNQFNR